MSSQSTVTFKVAGNDVISYMDKIKQKADQMTGDMIANAKKQADAGKDQLKALEDQIKALERKNKIESEMSRRSTIENREGYKEQNESEYNKKIKEIREDPTLTTSQKAERGGTASDIRNAKNDMASKDARDQLTAIREQERQAALQTRLLKDNVETIKTTSNQQLIQMRRGDDSIVQELDETATPMDKLAHEVAQQRHDEEHKPPKEEPEKKEGAFGGFLKAMALERGLGLAAQIPSAKNELDFVKPMMSMMGMAMGGLAGNLLDMADVKILGTGAGQSNWGAMGTQIGEKAGEFFGQAMQRSYQGRDQLTGANFHLQALTGQNLGIDAIGGKNGLGGTGMSSAIANLEEYGLTMKEASELQYRIATSQGNSHNMGRNAENMVATDRALAVSQETQTSLIEMRRQYSGDITKLVGGIAQKGANGMFAGDRTFLNEFIGKNFVSLQKELLKNGADNVSTGATFDILNRFNNVGGAFSARDPRSGGLINSIQGSLVNPGSDAMKAMSFMALRQSNPGMGLADLQVEREKGLSSPTYMKSMMQRIMGMGGDEQFQRMNLASAFGISNTAAKRLYEHRGAIMNGSISQGELAGTGAYGEDAIRASGQAQTSKYSKSTAEIENAFVKDVAGAITLVGTKMKDLFGDMVGEMKQYVSDLFAGKSTTPGQTVKKNLVLTDQQKKVLLLPEHK